MTGMPVPAIAPVQPLERVLWRLRKESRIAEARVRELPFGCELRFIADGVLRWSQVFQEQRGEIGTARSRSATSLNASDGVWTSRRPSRFMCVHGRPRRDISSAHGADA